MAYRDNWNEVNHSLIRLEGEMKPQKLTLENNMEYASYLQNKKGFYVFSPTVSVDFVNRALRETGKVLPLTAVNVSRALEYAGFNLVAFLRTLTTKLRPPAKLGEGMRQAHPGGWADITGNLNAAYRFRVNRGQ